MGGESAHYAHKYCDKYCTQPQPPEGLFAPLLPNFNIFYVELLSIHFGQIGTQQRIDWHLREVAAMDNAQPCCGRELGPVGGTPEPVQVLPQEGVYCCPAVHHCVREDCG